MCLVIVCVLFDLSFPTRLLLVRLPGKLKVGSSDGFDETRKSHQMEWKHRTKDRSYGSNRSSN